MHRVPAVLAVLGLSVLTLAACSSAPAGTPGASCDRPQSDATVLDFAQTSGDFGTPALALDAPVYVPQTTFTDVTVGDGMRVTSDVQDVQFSIALANGATGQVIGESGTQVQSVASWGTRFAGLATMLMCATEGSRIVGAIPSSDMSDEAVQGLGLTSGQTLVVTVDLQRVYLGAADGAPQYNDRGGMPSVVTAPDGRPGVIVPDGAAPDDLAVETLKKGTGPVVGADDTARVQYLAVDWKTRAVNDSTWQSGASAPVAPGSKVAFASQLQGATVGSQLLVVAPATTDGGSATIYVVDILGIDDPAPTR